MLNLAEAERNFWDNAGDNARRAKCRTKARHRGILRIVRPEAVLKKLSELGITITERTLQKYVKNELIPMPERKSAGRGRGKITDYPEEAPAEFYASYNQVHGKIKWPLDKVAAARKRALRVKDDPLLFGPRMKGDKGDKLAGALAVNWLLDKARAEAGILDQDVELILDYTNGKKDS